MACAFNCLGSGECLYAAATSCTAALLTSSSNTTSDITQGYTFDPSVASSLGYSECGCRCTSGDTASTGTFFFDPTILSANCAIWSPLANAFSIANMLNAVVSALFAGKIIVHCLFNDAQIWDRSPKGHFAQFILHNRAFFFSLHALVWTLILFLDEDKHLDQSKGLAIMRIIIGFQVMGSTIAVVYLWTKLLPMKIMKNEPIMKLVNFVARMRVQLEVVVLLMFITAAIFVLLDDFSTAVIVWNTSIALICPMPMYFISAISTNLYKKMHPDTKTVGKMSTIPALIVIFTKGASSTKEQPDVAKAKFEAVVFKLRLSCLTVIVIGSGAISISLGLAYIPVINAIPDYFDALLIFCALAFFAAMEFIFSPVRFAKARQEAQKVSEHHASTVEEDLSGLSAEEEEMKTGSAKVTPA